MHPRIWLGQHDELSDRVYARMTVLPGLHIKERLRRTGEINGLSSGFAIKERLGRTGGIDEPSSGFATSRSAFVTGERV